MSDQKARYECMKVVADLVETLYDQGDLEWGECDFANTPIATRIYLDTMINGTGIKFQMAKPLELFEGSYFFKLEDSLVGFLHHDPITKSHMWIDNKFKYGLKGQAVFNYLTARKIENGAMRSRDDFFELVRRKNKRIMLNHSNDDSKLSALSERRKPRNYFELRSYKEPKRLIAKGDIWYISELVKKNEEMIYGSTHFLVSAGSSLIPYLPDYLDLS
jgi:hypothetical protein